MARPFKAIPAALFAAASLCAAAGAQSSSPSDWTRPYGQAHGQETRPYSGARQGGNRVVINGVIQTGVGVSAQASAYANGSAGVSGGVNGEAGMTGPFAGAGATAIGNQLNVVVNGNYNTVVVNSRQTNNGAVTATAGATANGQTASESDHD